MEILKHSSKLRVLPLQSDSLPLAASPHLALVVFHTLYNAIDEIKHIL